MADTKEIKIVAGIDTKMDSRATKLLNKTLASLVDPKNLKEANKQYGEMAKIMKAIGVDQGKITKMMDKDMLGGIKKSTVAIKEYARELDRVKKIQGRYATGAGQEGFIARHAMGIAGGAEAWRGMSEADRVAARQLAMERWQRNQANYTSALDRMEQGAKAIAMERVSQDEEARMTARQKLGSQLYTAGVGVQMAAGLIQGGLGMEAQSLQNKAAYLGFGRNLYNQLASGDVGGVQAIRAIMKDPELAARIAEKARLGSTVGNIGQASAGILKFGGSAAMGGGGMLMGGGAAANDMLGGIGGVLTDQAGAVEARSAMAAISAQGTLDDPRFQRAMNWMHANRSQMAYRERMGMGGADLAARMGDYGRFAGLDVQRSLGVHDEMAKALGFGEFGNNMAENYAGLAMAAQATRGVDVGAATRFFAASGQNIGAMGSSIGGFGGRYAIGQDQRSKEEFERTLARGFAAGFKDPNVRNALVDYAAQAAVNVYSGRGGGAQGIGELMAMGMGGRDRSDIYEQRMAMSGYDITNKALAGGAGYYGSLRFSTAGRTLRKMGGGDAYEQSALGTATMDELGSILSGNVPDRILSAFGGNKKRALDAVRAEFGAGSIGPLLQSVAPAIGQRYGEIYGERKKIKGSDLSPESIYKQIWQGTEARDREVREKSYYAATQNFLGVQGLGAGEARSSMDILFGLASGGAGEIAAPKSAGFFSGVLNQITNALGQGGKPGAATTADVQVLTAQLTEVKDASGKFAEELTTIYRGYQAIMEVAQYDGGPAKVLNDAAAALENLAKKAQPLADLNVIQ